jgi:polyhydroxybutyrate depolymerase
MHFSTPSRSFILLAALHVTLTGCGTSETTKTTAATSSTGASTGGMGGTGGAGGTGGDGGAVVIGGDRPVSVHVPPAYDPAKPAPLVLLLHGYGASGNIQELYFNLKAETDPRGYIFAAPDGLVDPDGKRYWNATNACCDFVPTNVDDSTYLSTVIDQIKARYNVDPKRVYLVGHSNGGFMSYRMACDHADQIAAIVSLAGATFADDSKCKPSQPVAVLQIHGDADGTIAYLGGTLGPNAFPSALQTAQFWAAHDGCDPMPTAGGTKDIESALAGAETTLSIYGANCKAGGHVELWTIAGGAHIPSLGPTFKTEVMNFLDAHPKP